MLYRKTVNSCVGGWIYVYQQVRGIATLVDFYLTVRDPTGKSIHVFNVQHHLCLITLTSLMPASLFGHSRVSSVEPTKVLWHKKRRMSSPPIVIFNSYYIVFITFPSLHFNKSNTPITTFKTMYGTLWNISIFPSSYCCS